MRTAIVFMLLVGLLACGNQLVEFPAAYDAGGDAALEARADVQPMARDAAAEASAEARDAVPLDAQDAADVGDAHQDAKTDRHDVGACSLPPVDICAASSFAVLAGSTVTSTGPAALTGDLGVSPGAAVTGFPPGSITGAQFVGDLLAAAAQAALTDALKDAQGRTLCAVTVAGNLGGQTLAPGLYTSTSSLSVTSGALTLDAGGDPSAVWIFQAASTLTTGPASAVILAGGARAGNVFWAVGTSATLGTGSTFAGTIMADQSITLTTGATLTGRALARIGAVTLDAATVVVP